MGGRGTAHEGLCVEHAGGFAKGKYFSREGEGGKKKKGFGGRCPSHFKRERIKPESLRIARGLPTLGESLNSRHISKNQPRVRPPGGGEAVQMTLKDGLEDRGAAYRVAASGGFGGDRKGARNTKNYQTNDRHEP